MNQVPVQKIVSDCGKAVFIIDNDMSLGILHDFLLLLKGEFVDRMVKVQKEQEEEVAERDAAAEQPVKVEEVAAEKVEEPII